MQECVNARMQECVNARMQEYFIELRDTKSITVRFQLRYFSKYFVRKLRQSPAMPQFSA